MYNKEQNIVVIDYGMGNIGSISNMLKYLGYSSTVTNDIQTISDARKLILPGVGHFDRAMNNIEELGIKDIIIHKANVDKVPFLGICLGMQIMCNSSEEGTKPGLGLVQAQVKKFSFTDPMMKVPHMGWNTVEFVKNTRIVEDLGNNSRFYFVHSYFVECDNPDDVLTFTTYGNRFVSSFEKGNIIGAQFHPEKSHKFGISLFKNFLEKY